MSKSLFELIKTLSKAEKRVFSEKIKETKRKYYYTKLISVYAKHEEYSLKLDQKIFKKEGAKMISDCKRKCKQLLLDYLVELHKNRRIRQQIETNYQTIAMLMNRKLYEQAIKMLDKTEPLAIKYEILDHLILLKKMRIAINLSIMGCSFETDLDYMKQLFYEKKKAIEQLAETEESMDKFNLEFLQTQIGGGYIRNRPGTKKKSTIPFKNIKLSLIKLQGEFFNCLNTKDRLEALEAVTKILDVTKENRDIVLKAKLLTVPYAIFLRSYVELSIECQRNFDIQEVLREFEYIPFISFPEKFNIIESKTVTHCLYSLYTNDPASALPEIRANESFFKKSKDQENRYKFSLEHCTLVHLALKNWNKCHALIDEIETFEISDFLRRKTCNFRLICIYEQNDLHYFNAIIEKELVKRRKKRIKLKDCKTMYECVFNFLYYLSKGSTSKYADSFKYVLDSFNGRRSEYRYIIHWMVYRFPELNNKDYQTFLKDHNIRHYSFDTSTKQLLKSSERSVMMNRT